MSMPPRDYSENRAAMVATQIAARGVTEHRVLAVMRSLPRESFVPSEQVEAAYEDRAMPIGHGQTISQPYIVAYMTEALHLRPVHRVLEIGTGTGYQTAVLASLASRVFSIERIESLSRRAESRLVSLGLSNVEYRVGDGSRGWTEEAPFDRILIAAGSAQLPKSLLDQLADDGRLVAPIGPDEDQRLILVERIGGRIIERPTIAVRFVPLISGSGVA